MGKHICIRISGKVQGVGFRYHAQKIADEIGVKGFVKNEYDGSVYIEAFGEIETIDLFIKWCYQGPPWAHIEEVKISENKTKHFNTFTIK